MEDDDSEEISDDEEDGDDDSDDEDEMQFELETPTPKVWNPDCVETLLCPTNSISLEFHLTLSLLHCFIVG